MGKVKNFFKNRLEDLKYSSLAAVLLGTPLLLNCHYAYQHGSSAGSFFVGSNKVDVVKYSGLIENYYTFSRGSNVLASLDGWDGTSGKFELDGKIVSFDKWDGPYTISDKPINVKLSR